MSHEDIDDQSPDFAVTTSRLPGFAVPSRPRLLKPGFLQGLGDLPPDMAIVRGEIDEARVMHQGPPGIVRHIPDIIPFTPVTEPQPLLPSPRDIIGAEQAIIQIGEDERFTGEKIPFTPPDVNFLVQSTFDARPINANDFQFAQLVSLAPGTTDTNTVRFIVPAGRVAIIRGFSWFPSIVLAGATTFDPAVSTDNISINSPFSVRLTVTGQTQQTFEDIFEQSGTVETYAIAAAGETIEFTATINPLYDLTLPASYDDFAVFFNGHGNLLNTLAREKQYEPANQYRYSIDAGGQETSILK